MEKEIKFIHLSDIHLTPADGKNIYQMGIDRTKKFRAVFADIVWRDLRPDFFLISGDLIHEGTAADYRELKAMIESEKKRLGVPGFVCLGNHDNRRAFWEGFKNCPNQPEEREYYYSTMIGAFRLIALDSKQVGREEGRISDKQLVWLENQLKQPAALGTVIMLHHPLNCAPFHLMKYSILQNTDHLAAVLRGTDVLAVLSGHVHFYANYQVAGILNSVVTAVSYGIDCTHPDRHPFIDDSGYQLVTIRDAQVMTQQWSLASAKTVRYVLKLPEESIN
ncbi:MAG: metallophosphoesterase [Sporolactobacillus sp.]|jgi:3',5'-cyclic-nucleotide phosphodiesterase|nr:metallophosphoesterase [Sporolactobacillus sp.]